MNAYCLLRQGPVYRREAFLNGLAAAGLNVSNTLPRTPGPQDVLVIWNRYAENDDLARRFEVNGARVIVAENGYLGFGSLSHRAHDQTNRRVYAIALHDHNGRGAWPWPRNWTEEERAAFPPSRFAQLGVEVKAWRNGGEKILVCAQRGIGSPGRASPPSWAERVALDIRKTTPGLRVVVRPHPGDNDPAIPLEQDLAGAAACVIWASGAGVKALVEGVPVFYACPWWVCHAGARRYGGPASLLFPARNDVQRAKALEQMAWAQWTCDEISTGEPFRRLLELAYPKPKAVAA